MCMEFEPLYKGITLTIHGQCTNYTRGVQDYHLCSILINYDLFFLVIQGLHTLMPHFSIIHSFHALYYTCTLIFEHLPHQ